MVAVGVMLAVGEAETVEEAEEMLRETRSGVKLSRSQRAQVKAWFQAHR